VSSCLTEALVPSQRNGERGVHVVRSTALSAEPIVDTKSLTNDVISNLRYREAQRELEHLDLDSSGTLSSMKSRLREAVGSHYPVSSDLEEKTTIDDNALDKVSSMAIKSRPLYDGSAELTLVRS
jgi:hypothetical protein